MPAEARECLIPAVGHRRSDRRENRRSDPRHAASRAAAFPPRTARAMGDHGSRFATNGDGPVVAMQRTAEILIALETPKIRQDAVPAPTRGAGSLPFIIVARVLRAAPTCP